MTDLIKAKIQELCPDVMERQYRTEMCGDCYELEDNMEDLPDTCKKCRWSARKQITLAVVLRTIGMSESEKDLGYGPMRVSNVGIDAEGNFIALGFLDGVGFDGKWNLTKDSYDDQTVETKTFIGSLLGV